ncbi:hypothetical protein PybrP1_008039 [[Pythium] brassicae (nom. inval.)]|nr:hypothetical protein PybrP1_008039 [[Pythium] brassicae (nom. inval.)]
MFRGAAAAHEPSPPPPTEQVRTPDSHLSGPLLPTYPRTQRPHPHSQRADPKRAWLDAIMSKARQSDVSPFASAASTPTMALAPQPAADRWPPRAEYAPLPPAGFRHAPPPAVVYQEQLAMDDRVLAEAMALAFDRMVAEQACSFIAKGMCHLCGTSERHLIPVANFCPDFHASHSLCREHLRSSHHLRIEDIFAGKGRPTVSKRALKCKVCSRECACSTCQLEKQHELSKYKRWLAGEHEFALDIRDRLAEPLARQQLGSGFSARPSGPGYATLDESQAGGVTHRPEPYPRRHEGVRARRSAGAAPEHAGEREAPAAPAPAAARRQARSEGLVGAAGAAAGVPAGDRRAGRVAVGGTRDELRRVGEVARALAHDAEPGRRARDSRAQGRALPAAAGERKERERATPAVPVEPAPERSEERRQGHGAPGRVGGLVRGRARRFGVHVVEPQLEAEASGVGARGLGNEQRGVRRERPAAVDAARGRCQSSADRTVAAE